jgi:hypothetical protein
LPPRVTETQGTQCGFPAYDHRSEVKFGSAAWGTQRSPRTRSADTAILRLLRWIWPNMRAAVRVGRHAVAGRVARGWCPAVPRPAGTFRQKYAGFCRRRPCKRLEASSVDQPSYVRSINIITLSRCAHIPLGRRGLNQERKNPPIRKHSARLSRHRGVGGRDEQVTLYPNILRYDIGARRRLMLRRFTHDRMRAKSEPGTRASGPLRAGSRSPFHKTAAHSQ